MSSATAKYRFGLYGAVNLLFLLVLMVVVAIGQPTDPRLLYIILLFAMCSTSIIDLDGLNGRYSLLAVFMLAYFIFYGAGDVTSMLYNRLNGFGTEVLSEPELVILAGCALLIIGYRAALNVGGHRKAKSSPRDLSPRTILISGLCIWAIGTAAMYNWYVHIVTNVTIEATHAGLAKLSPLVTIGYILAQMLQPLGILLVAYAWRMSRSRTLLTLVVGMVMVQAILGFIIDIKGVAMLGWLLVIVTSALVDGRVAKQWLAAAGIFVVVAFPVYQANRALTEGNRTVSRAAVVENLLQTIQKAISAKDKVNSGQERAQTFLERLSLKSSVELIVGRVGKDVPFQNGYTLQPIVSTFLPKIIWSDKPDIPTGQIMNRVFHVTEQEETYISPSHLGELYWNYGWSGVFFGMLAIGGICGIIGRFNLAEAKTVTRLLVIVLTIRYVISGFEGSIAGTYVTWLRSLAAVALLYLAFARESVVLDRSRADTGADSRPTADTLPPLPAFPNLMR